MQPSLKRVKKLEIKNDLTGALSMCQSMLEGTDKQNDELWHYYGRLSEKTKNTAMAVQSYSNAHSLNPQKIEYLVDLAQIYFKNGEPTLTLNVLKKLLKLDPQNKEGQKLLASVHHANGDSKRAVLMIEKLLKDDPKDFLLTVAYSQCLSGVGDNEKAKEVALKALDMADTPLKKVKALISLSTPYDHKGELDKALECLEKAIKLDPDNANAVSGFLRVALNKNDLKAIEDTIDFNKQDYRGDKWSNKSISFSLARYYDKKKDYDTAFAYYKRGNELTYRDFNRPQLILNAKSTIENFSPEVFPTLPHAPQDNDAPIFIVGLPRSGTTLIERVISTHPDVSAGEELTYIGEIVYKLRKNLGSANNELDYIHKLTPEILQKAADRYLQLLKEINPTARFITDKMPGNFMHVGFISLAFPKAKIIYANRSILGSCLSCYFQSFRSVQFADTLEDLAHAVIWKIRLMDHWKKLLGDRLIEIKYEDFVEDFDTHSQRLFDYLGLEWTEDAREFYKKGDENYHTASYNQVKQPIYKSSQEKWRHYEEYLQPLIKILKENGINPYQ